MKRERINISTVYIEGFRVNSIVTYTDVNPKAIHDDTHIKNKDILIKTVERKTNEAFSDNFYWDFQVAWSDNSVDNSNANEFANVIKSTEDEIKRITNDTIRSIFIEFDISDLVNRILRMKQESTLDNEGKIRKCGITIREIIKAII